jgi:hypothetical protein
MMSLAQFITFVVVVGVGVGVDVSQEAPPGLGLLY